MGLFGFEHDEYRCARINACSCSTCEPILMATSSTSRSPFADEGRLRTMSQKLAALCRRAEDEAGWQSDIVAATLVAEIDRELVCVRDALVSRR